MATEYRVMSERGWLVGSVTYDNKRDAELWATWNYSKNPENSFKVVKREVGDWQDA